MCVNSIPMCELLETTATQSECGRRYGLARGSTPWRRTHSKITFEINSKRVMMWPSTRLHHVCRAPIQSPPHSMRKLSCSQRSGLKFCANFICRALRVRDTSDIGQIDAKRVGAHARTHIAVIHSPLNTSRSTIKLKY